MSPKSDRKRYEALPISLLKTWPLRGHVSWVILDLNGHDDSMRLRDVLATHCAAALEEKHIVVVQSKAPFETFEEGKAVNTGYHAWLASLSDKGAELFKAIGFQGGVHT